jgi:hypothetical protein
MEEYDVYIGMDVLRVQPKISARFRASRRPSGKARGVNNI